MNRSKEIKELLKDIVGGNCLPLVIGEVVSVESETCTVRVAGRVTVGDVRLNASADGNDGNILVKPVVGSIVLMSDLSGGDLRELVVTAWSEIDTVTVKLKGDVIINGGGNEGIVKVIELTKKLNNIEKDINVLKNKFLSWVPTVYDGGAALKALATDWASQQLMETQQKDIEDERIKH